MPDVEIDMEYNPKSFINASTEAIESFIRARMKPKMDSLQDILNLYFDEKMRFERHIIRIMKDESARPFTVEKANEYFNLENKYAKIINDFNKEQMEKENNNEI